VYVCVCICVFVVVCVCVCFVFLCVFVCLWGASWDDTSGWSVQTEVAGPVGHELKGTVDFAKSRKTNMLRAIVHDDKSLTKTYRLYQQDSGIWANSLSAQDGIITPSIGKKDLKHEAVAFLDGSNVIKKFMQDSVTVDDSISFRAFISIEDGARGDSVTASDKLTIGLLMEDTATVDDSISMRVFYSISESASVNDSISFRAFISIEDGARGDAVL